MMDERYDGIVREHYIRIYNYLWHLCADEHQAQDLCQDVFLKAWRNLDGFDGRSSVSTWLFSIARNTWLDHTRQRMPTTKSLDELSQDPPDPAPLSDEIIAGQQLTAFIDEAICRLPEEEKTAILLHYREDVSYRELAQILEVPNGTAKYLVSCGLVRLRHHLQTLFVKEDIS